MVTRPRIVPKSPSLHLRALTLAATATLALAGRAQAQFPVPLNPSSTQFDVTGFLQSAALDPACTAAPAHCGGTLTVNGHVITVPAETIVILPANALTWQELFAQAPAPYTGVATGMAQADLPAPLTTYEVHVVGNRVITGGDRYIAGMINITQQGLNSGAGFVNYINYATGELRVGGLVGSTTTGARVQLNDPTGRFGRVVSADKRFTVDPDNPTITSATAFPMCIPRTDPAVADDPLCPQGNRPFGVTSFTTNDPTVLGPNVLPSASFQAPFEVGDYVTFAGTLVSDNAAAPTVALAPGATTGTYISAHTITNNVAIYTFPGTNPAYVAVEVALIGTGGLTVIGAGEAVIRTRFEGMSSDPTRNVHLYGVDLDPLTGATTDRDWGTIGVDPGAPTGAVKGRWRFRPPCLPFGTVPTKPDKQCVMNALGTFLPPTREMRAVIEGLQLQNPAVAGATTAANGLYWGQYHAPIGEYIFPENIPGAPIVPNNFETIQFLAQGGYTSATGTLVGQLNPWPGVTAPPAACTLPVAAAGTALNVAFGGSVTLQGTASGTAPQTFAWTTTAGVLTGQATLTPNLNVAGVAGGTVITVSLAVTGCGATSTASTTVTVNPAAAPVITVAAAPGLLVSSGQQVTLTATSNTAGTTFAWTQVSGPVAAIVSPTAGASIRFTRTLPLGQVTNDVFVFTVVGTANGSASSPVSVTVTVKPVPDGLLVTTAEYRTSKQRLIINITDTLVSPNVVLKLSPYKTTSGAIFDPTLLGNTFTNNGAGLYVLTLVGAPQPAAGTANGAGLTVTSNIGGTVTTPLLTVRQ